VFHLERTLLNVSLTITSIPLFPLLLLVVRLSLAVMMMIGAEIIIASAVVQGQGAAVDALMVDVGVAMGMAPGHTLVFDALVAGVQVVVLGKEVLKVLQVSVVDLDLFFLVFFCFYQGEVTVV
jgi:hypothetical protein